MSLGASTLLVFLFLVPGLIFRYSLYQGSLIKRPFFGSNTVYSTVAVIFFSLFIYVVAFLFSVALSIALRKAIGVSLPFSMSEMNGIVYIQLLNENYEVINFASYHPFISTFAVVGVCVLSIAIAAVTRWLAIRLPFLARMLYGPLATLVCRSEAMIVTCFVMSKIFHDNKRIVYAGFPREISLGEGNVIDNIIIESPEKFYMTLGKSEIFSSRIRAKPITKNEYSYNIMYITGNQIENVHFEGFDIAI